MTIDAKNKMIVVVHNSVSRYINGEDRRKKFDPLDNPATAVLKAAALIIIATEESSSNASTHAMVEGGVLNGNQLATWTGHMLYFQTVGWAYSDNRRPFEAVK